MLLPALLFVLSTAQPAPACASADDCLRQAVAAEASGDFETFHDLAWRAVQKGRPNDPDLMYVLARAMSESGRPGDALVMLARLADMGAKVDASGDAFRRVRALKGWSEVEARLALGTTPLPPARGTSPATATVPGPDVPAAPVTAAAPAPISPGEPFDFETAPFDPAGLAYDEVSRRFLLGDRRTARLVIVDQESHRVTPLVGAMSAGFFDTLTGFDIDHRRGDLWVVSTQGEGDAAESMLHKLQLVSGRVLLQIPTEPGIRLVDVAVAGDGAVYALDGIAGHLFRLHAGSHVLDRIDKLGVEHPTSLALGDDHVAYVASASGIVRVDLASRAVTPVTAPGALGSIELVRAHGRALFVVERRNAAGRLLRLTLDSSGRAVTGVVPLDPSIPPSTAATIVGTTLYYLSGRGQIRSLKIASH